MQATSYKKKQHVNGSAFSCYLLLATCYLLLATCYLLLATCYLLLAAALSRRSAPDGFSGRPHARQEFPAASCAGIRPRS
ncbi:hypothetical protein FYM84_08750 [Pseudomonas sp. CAH-1]|nr:hypothetical protein [Pseudomonas sp. CAH-1]